MSYIGNTQQNQSFVPAVDFFSGNGSTTAFTLSKPVASTAQIQAVISNVPQTPGVAYTVSGSTITFTSAPPSGTNNIYVYYTSPNTQVIAPSDASVQTSSIANGVVTPAKLSTGYPYWDSSGNVGIGVIPNAWGSAYKAMQIGASASFGSTSGTAFNFMAANTVRDSSDYKYINANYATQYYQLDGTHVWRIAPSGAVGGTITWTEAMRIDSSGNVGIGTSSPDTKLGVNGKIALSDDLVFGSSATNATRRAYITYNAGGDNGSLVLLADPANAYASSFMGFQVDGSERMRIDSSGNLLVGKTTFGVNSGVGVQAGASGTLSSTKSTSANTDDTLHVYSTGVSAYRFYVGMGGTVYATSTTISGISDQRLKENVRDLDAGLNEVLALKPRVFDWKEGKGKGIKNDRGFIAQEFEQVFPDLIDEWKDPAPEGEEPYKSVRQDLIPVLVKAIQELKAELDDAKNRIAVLEAK